MSVRARWLAALLLLVVAGLLRYLAAGHDCFEAGGGWQSWSGCHAIAGQEDGASGTRAAATLPPSGRDSAHAPEPPPVPVSYVGRGLVVRLIDSTHWRVEEGLDMEGTLWRVEVSAGGHTDTIPEVRTDALPVIVGDSLLFGFSLDQHQIVAGFEYRVARRDQLTFETPEFEFRSWFVHPEISPDGQHVAIWNLLDDGVGRIEIHEWPGKVLESFSPEEQVGGGDADLGGIRWIAPDTLEYGILGEAGKVYHGTGTPHGFGPVDTLRH